jgi:hypothetical protein
MHAVVLCGHNDDRVAYICDNGFTQILEVPLDELKKARSSKFGPTFMHPKNGQFIIGKRPDGKKPPFAAAVKLAIKQVADNMRRASINTNGLSGMKLMLDSIPNWPDVLNDEIVFNGKKIPKAYFTLEMLYGYIEEYGTGGGNFRNLYSRFLKELSSHQEILEGSNSWKDQEISFLNDACDLIKESGDLWSRFAQEIKKGLTKSVENCLETIDFKKLEEILEKIILLEEEAFTNLSKIKI